MTMKKIVSGLVTELRSSVAKQGLNNRKDISSVTLATESMDESARASAMTARDSLSALIDDSIDIVLNTESAGSRSVSVAQRDAARHIAALAIDPASGMQAIAQAHSPNALSGAVTVSAEDMGVSDIVEPGTLSTEAFDGQSLDNALYFSIAYNLFAAKQDEFGEAFFPTITIDPAMSGITIGTEVTSLYTDVVRGIDGAPNRAKFAKVTLAKAIYDNNILGVDRNKVVPVSRPENAAMLVPVLDNVDTTTGESVTTAPLKIGTEVNLLGISQTDAMLAKGTMDAYDALDRTVNLSTVIISLTDTAGVTPVTEYFRVPVGMLPHSNFTYSTQGQDKDLGLSFDTTDVAFLTSTSLMSNGAASTILAALPAAHKVKIRLKLTGDGNTQYGDVAVYATIASVDSIADAAGNVLAASNADHVTITAAFANMAVVGYELEAYLTNSNLRKQGQLVTIDPFEQIYNVPVRSGISVVAPVNSSSSDDSRLIGQVQTTGYRMSLDAVDTLVGFADNLGVLTANGANTDIALMGVGRHHVDAHYTEAVLDLAAIVDSESSSDRADDIRAALLGRIRDEVYIAFTASNFNVAHSMIHGGDDRPVGVIIGTSSRVKNYLCGAEGTTVDLGSGFIAKVVATPNLMIGDTMYITFSDHMSATRNSAVDPISFGQCVCAPTITTDVATTVNGAVTRRFQTHPRYLHITNLPILMRLRVVGIETVLGKVSRFTKTVI